jgi:hypothetical protein
MSRSVAARLARPSVSIFRTLNSKESNNRRLITIGGQKPWRPRRARCAQPPSRYLSRSRLCDAAPPREWLYGKHYIRKFVSVTVAPGGLGKSSLVFAVAIASGRDLLKNGFPKRLRVAVWNGEDPKDELDRRILAIMLHFGVAPKDVDGQLALASGRETPLCLMRLIDGVAVATPNVEQVKSQGERSRRVHSRSVCKKP